MGGQRRLSTAEPLANLVFVIKDHVRLPGTSVG
jgi:hypothetical protein